MKFNIQCPRCGGTGKVQSTCPTCHGEGVVTAPNRSSSASSPARATASVSASPAKATQAWRRRPRAIFT